MAKKATTKKATPAKKLVREKVVAKRTETADTKRKKERSTNSTEIPRVSLANKIDIQNPSTRGEGVLAYVSPHINIGPAPSIWYPREMDFGAALPDTVLRYHLEVFDVVVALGQLRNAIAGIEHGGHIALAAQSIGFRLARLDAAPSALGVALYSDTPIPCFGKFHQSYHEAVRAIGREVLFKLRALAGLKNNQHLNQQTDSNAFFEEVLAKCDAIKQNWRYVEWDADELNEYISWEWKHFSDKPTEYLDLILYVDDHSVGRKGKPFEGIIVELPAKACWPAFKAVLGKKGEPLTQRERDNLSSSKDAAARGWVRREVNSKLSPLRIEITKDWSLAEKA